VPEDEDRDERLNRELIELLNELRVALPGVQVLFAFLLTVPFTQRFTEVSSFQEDIYFAALLAAAAATVFLIAPSSYHRLRWRQHDKERMLITANRLSIAGTMFLAVAMTCSVLFITDFLFRALATGLVTGTVAGLFTWLWYGLPLLRRLRERPLPGRAQARD
jgi:hypothetical protein